MSTYAVAYVRKVVNPSPEIAEYLRRVSDTMDPFGGRFLVHDGEREVLEGTWPGGLIIIEFPDRAKARAWYDSEAYRAILPFRTDHIEMDVIFADGVPEGYRASEALAKLPF
ncbi:DUF1330 domain-containing protein [Streptomyces sp. H10-C2]|uniref:DUF1330 domain-containing protein n=1 Tax=unclassified Streptomyces TaxID=2593676 RepID=UPI0024BBE777|nr:MULTISPECIES: DUF1330 domain-containing protein [unclassified Streptomyces]MDJ0342148.1 DUF1330 domain-containing protein [Streptomyces sp. PH10-H1]MDJ0368662.1 DUF1330 domain-containing protein [Streptomyces sp. H10-C2]